MNATATKSRRVLPPAEAPPDYGPPERLARGEVERHYRPDPERPNVTIRGARRTVLYDLAWRRGSITDAEREAADRYAVLTERVMARGGGNADGAVRVAPWQRTPPEAVVAAMMQLRCARTLVGRDGAALLDAWVVGGVSADTLAQRRGEVRDAVMGRIRAALGLLAEAWGM